MSRGELEAALCPPGAPKRHRQLLDGIEDYLFIGGGRMPAALAAERLGVSARTVVRWRSELRQAGVQS